MSENSGERGERDLRRSSDEEAELAAEVARLSTALDDSQAVADGLRKELAAATERIARLVESVDRGDEQLVMLEERHSARKGGRRPASRRAMTRVALDVGYIVPSDRPDTIAEAKRALFEDVMNAVKYDELGNWIVELPAPGATMDHVPEFLRDEEEGSGAG